MLPLDLGSDSTHRIAGPMASTSVVRVGAAVASAGVPGGSEMFFGDATFLLLIPALLFAFWAQWKVQSTYRKYSEVPASNHRTGREIALAIMSRNGSDVSVEPVGGMLSDHYDPRTKVVRLSQPNYQDSSIASIAVAAHEVGHVLQHAEGYAPLQIRSAIAPVASFGSMLAFPLFFIGLVFRIPGVSPLLMDL